MPVRLQGDLQKLSKKLQSIKSPMRHIGAEIGEAMVSSTIQRFNNQHAPDGTPWQPLAAATVLGGLKSNSWTKRGRISTKASKELQGRKILIQTARLRNSIATENDDRFVAVGTNVKYARIHQLGGNAGRGRKVVIPARPFLGVSDEDKKEIRRIVKSNLGGP